MDRVVRAVGVVASPYVLQDDRVVMLGQPDICVFACLVVVTVALDDHRVRSTGMAGRREMEVRGQLGAVAHRDALIPEGDSAGGHGRAPATFRRERASRAVLGGD